MNCSYCNREIKNMGSLKAHEMSCKSNPNKIKHKHSPLAGAKKGTTSWNKGIKIGTNKIWKDLFPNEKIFVEESTYARHLIKKRIRKENLIEYNCALCKIEPFWNGKPMTLVLDHINGINNDNRLSNLRFVCSNCDSQLDTYKSKNRKGARAVE